MFRQLLLTGSFRKGRNNSVASSLTKRAFSGFKQTKSEVKGGSDKKAYVSQTTKDISLIRNIGIIAHIDAGKTTTTERMIYYAGGLARPGEVHHGNTVMDYMEQERKRGITIRAATVAFHWEGHQINLIDTPGHVDFSAEVERSLRVCDGAVTIFDGMMGVETQSETVWMQANRFQVPRLGFINKLDRLGASLETTTQSIKKRLKVDPIMINVPAGETSNLKGLIDLTQMLHIDYSKDELGNTVDLEEIVSGHHLYDQAIVAREKMIEQLSNYDDQLGDLYLSEEIGDIDSASIDRAIRKAILSGEAVPLMCGSALKNKGVQPLLDAVVKYLPDPSLSPAKATNEATGEVFQVKPTAKGKLCALAFKVVNDKEKGLVTFFRVYQGSLKNRAKLKNATLNNEVETIKALLRVKADETQLLTEVGVGDIAAIVGLKNVRSGDTLIDENDQDRVTLGGVTMPPPVFFCSIEAESSRDQKQLEQILHNLSREDPSIQIKASEDTGQVLVSGQGELHLEILRDRIELEYGLVAELGPMRVAYRESIGQDRELEMVLDKKIGAQSFYAKLKIKLESTLEDFDITEMQKQKFEAEDGDDAFEMSANSFSIQEEDLSANLANLSQNQVTFDCDDLEPVTERIKLDGDEYSTGKKHLDKRDTAAGASMEIFKSLECLPMESKEALRSAIDDSLMSGSLLGYPVVNTRIRVLDGRWSNIRSKSPIIFQQCASQLLRQLISESSPCLLEPFMSVEISLPEHIIGTVLQDITGKRGGQILGVKSIRARFSDTNDADELDDSRKCLNALIPLSEMVGYSTYLRSISKGEAQFVMNFSHYERISGQKQAEVLNNPFF